MTSIIDRLPNVVTNIGPVQAHVRPVAEEVAQRWVLYFVWGAPGKGTGDHAEGLALDFMTYEHGDGVDDPGPRRDGVGNAIAAYVLENRVRLNVEYVIWNRRIASALSQPAWSWRTYYGDNPHTDHVHVSFKRRGTYTPPPTQEDPVTPADIEKVAQRAAELAAEKVWETPLVDAGAWTGLTPKEVLIGVSGKLDAEKARDAVKPAAKKATTATKGASK